MATKVGLLHLELMVGDAMTLKDKRRVVKSFKDRIANRFNVSIAEVDHLDSIRRCLLAVVMVSNDSRYIEGALQQIVNAATGHPGWFLVDYELEQL